VGQTGSFWGLILARVLLLSAAIFLQLATFIYAIVVVVDPQTSPGLGKIIAEILCHVVAFDGCNNTIAICAYILCVFPARFVSTENVKVSI